MTDNINNTKPKRKYVKHAIKSTEKKRGRKRKEVEYNRTPEDIIDFIIKSYPYIGLDKVKENILVALKANPHKQHIAYVLDTIEYNGKKYYYDMHGNILDANAQHVGHCEKKNDNMIIYMYSDIEAKYKMDEDISLDDIT